MAHYYTINDFANLISEGEVDAFLGDVYRPDLGVDDHLVGVGEPAHVGRDLKEIGALKFGQKMQTIKRLFLKVIRMNE